MIIIDYNECFGCGACAAEYPDIFEIRDEKAWVKSYEISPQILGKIIFICPVRAISIDK